MTYPLSIRFAFEGVHVVITGADDPTAEAYEVLVSNAIGEPVSKPEFERAIRLANREISIIRKQFFKMLGGRVS